jgi:hypothetical protein
VVGDNGQRIINRAGFYRVTEIDALTSGGEPIPKRGGRREYLALPQAFRQELCAGFDSRFAVKVLKDHGWLLSGTDRTAQSVSLPGMGKTRVYVLGTAMWQANR